VEDAAYREMYAQEDVHWWFRGRRLVIGALVALAGLPSYTRVLDAGCGTGRTMVELAGLGAVSGVDPSSDAVRFCRARGLDDVHQAGLEALPFANSAFDLVLACDVLEHVEDDLGALQELRRVTRTGGVLIVTVPAYRWMWTEHDVVLHHLRRYSATHLRHQATSAGWAVQRCTYFNSVLLPLAAGGRLGSRLLTVVARRRRGRTDLDRTPAVLNRVMELPLRFEASVIRAGSRFPAGVSIGMLCRNPG